MGTALNLEFVRGSVQTKLRTMIPGIDFSVLPLSCLLPVLVIRKSSPYLLRHDDLKAHAALQWGPSAVVVGGNVEGEVLDSG